MWLILSALFISNEMCSPYYTIEKISKVIVAKTNAIINITLKSSKPPLYLVVLLILFHHYEEDFVINAVCERCLLGKYKAWTHLYLINCTDSAEAILDPDVYVVLHEKNVYLFKWVG